MYAVFTKNDFTMMGGSLFVMAIILLIGGFFMGLGGWTKTTYIVYCGLGVFVYGLYLIYDVQLLVGGRNNEISIDDYVLASI